MKGGQNIRQNMAEHSKRTSLFLSYFPSYFHNSESDDAQLYLLSNQMTELAYEPSAVITTQGEKSQFSYIIGEGKVCLKHSYSEVREMTVKEYYLDMKGLRDTLKNEALNHTIELNKGSLPIKSLSDLDELDMIAYHVTLYNKVCNREDPVKVLSFLSQYDFYEAKKHSEDLRDAIEKSLLQIKKWRTKVQEAFEHERYGCYLPLAMNEVHKLNYARVDIIAHLKCGDIISKEGYDLIKGSIVYSAVAEEQCVLYKMKATILNRLFVKDQEKRFKDIYSFFKNIFLFKSLGDTKQLRKYAESSEIKAYNKGTIIHEENEDVDTIYILQEGRIEVKLNNMTLSSLRSKIQQLIQIANNLPEYDGSEDRHSLRYELLDPDDNEDESITKKRKDIKLNTISLFLIDSYEVFSLIEQYFHLPKSLVTIEVVSITANLLTIPRGILYKCIQERKHIAQPIAYDKLDNLIQRLMTLYQNHTDFHTKKVELKQFYDLPPTKKAKNTKIKLMLPQKTVISKTLSNHFGLLPKINRLIQQTKKELQPKLTIQLTEPAMWTPAVIPTPTQETMPSSDRYDYRKKQPSPRQAIPTFFQKINMTHSQTQINTNNNNNNNEAMLSEERDYHKMRMVMNSYTMISKGMKSLARNHCNKQDLQSLYLEQFDPNNLIHGQQYKAKKYHPYQQGKRHSIALKYLTINSMTPGSIGTAGYYYPNGDKSFNMQPSLKPDILHYTKNAVPLNT